MKPSPFPGMDPYLEAPHIWPDVHSRLMNVFAEQLAPVLSPNYLAELETQLIIAGIDEENDLFSVRPDVSVTRLNEPALVYAAQSMQAPLRWRLPPEAPTRLASIFIRERVGRKLVTVIELLSPVNKRRGPAREEYLDKRRSYLSSPIHLVEVDLLRGHPRMPFNDPLPRTDYLAMVSRVADRPECDIWPISLRQALPIIPIPLLAPDPDVALDIGQALRTAWQRARYDLRLDYSQPPAPPLTGADAAWAQSLIDAHNTNNRSTDQPTTDNPSKTDSKAT